MGCYKLNSYHSAFYKEFLSDLIRKSEEKFLLPFEEESHRPGGGYATMWQPR